MSQLIAFHNLTLVLSVNKVTRSCVCFYYLKINESALETNNN